MTSNQEEMDFVNNLPLEDAQMLYKMLKEVEDSIYIYKHPYAEVAVSREAYNVALSLKHFSPNMYWETNDKYFQVSADSDELHELLLIKSCLKYRLGNALDKGDSSMILKLRAGDNSLSVTYENNGKVYSCELKNGTNSELLLSYMQKYPKKMLKPDELIKVLKPKRQDPYDNPLDPDRRIRDTIGDINMRLGIKADISFLKVSQKKYSIISNVLIE